MKNFLARAQACGFIFISIFIFIIIIDIILDIKYKYLNIKDNKKCVRACARARAYEG